MTNMRNTENSSRNKKKADAVKELNWTEMLNEEAMWHGYADFETWFIQVAPVSSVPDPQSYEDFRARLAFMRAQAAKIYFGELPDYSLINAKLATISLEIEQPLEGCRLPSILARGDHILERLAGALLVGFAQFAAASQKGDGPALCRCQGVFKDAQANADNLDLFELQYRREISLLDEEGILEDPAVQRCADFFLDRPKARFCSDTCRFMTFQISKQLKDPSYLAEKQRRYRNKHKS